VTKGGFWLNVVLGTLGIIAFVTMTAVCGYKWLAEDEPNRAYGAGGSRGGTSFSGETTSMVLTFVFGGIALVLVVLAVTSVRRVWPTLQAHGNGSPVQHLQQLEALRAADVISDAEYQRRRQQTISEI